VIKINVVEALQVFELHSPQNDFRHFQTEKIAAGFMFVRTNALYKDLSRLALSSSFIRQKLPCSLSVPHESPIERSPFIVIPSSGSHRNSIIPLTFFTKSILIKCEEPVNGIPVSPMQTDSISIDSSRPNIDFLPSTLRPWFIAFCWSLLIGVWLTAALGPIYAGLCIYHGLWDSLLSFLCFWLIGGFLRFPSIPALTHLMAKGLESWFKYFTIDYEHAFLKQGNSVCSGRTIYCYHPHGLFSFGMVLLAVDLARKNEPVGIIGSSHMRWFNPLAKILLDLAGIELIGASSREVQRALRRGDRSLILVPGGYEEAVLTQNGYERLYLNNRLGFVKYAMRYGYSLTPVYAFGENDLYSCFPIADSVRNALARYKIPLALFYGDSNFPLMPRRTEEGLRIVVGEPFSVPYRIEPDIRELRATHSEYVEKLLQLYYRYNKEVDRPLEIV
jgi:1-acyl-sn-glycerol-3-phosphate acyltransferase